MRKFWATLAVQLGKRAGLVAILGLLITVGLGLGITQLKFATGQDAYLNKDEKTFKDNVQYQGLFGGQAMVVLFTMDKGKKVEDLFTPANIATQKAATAQIKAKIKASGKKGAPVPPVVSPLTALQFSDNLVQRSFADPTSTKVATDPTATVAGQLLLKTIDRETKGSAAQKARQANFNATATRLAAVKGPKDFSNPAWVKFLIYDNDGTVRKALRAFFFDSTHAEMVARLPGNASVEDEGKGATAVKETWADHKVDGAKVTVTGAAVLLKDINDYLRGGMLTLGAIAVAIMVVILLVLFDVRWRLLPLAVILIGVVWAFGLAGYLHIPLTLVTIAGLPVMLGVGIDYAIQLHARVEEEVVIDREPHPIQETAKNLCPALLVVTFDAVFAFAALHFARVPMIRDFGLLLAVGIVMICLCSIIAPLAMLGIREYKSPTKGRDFREGALGRFVVKLGSAPARAAVPLAVASILIFAGGVIVENKLVLQTDPVQWVNQKSKSIKDLRTLENQTGASSELGIFVRSNKLFSNDMATFMHDFTNDQLKKFPDQLLAANSIVTPASFLTEVRGTTNPAPTGAEVKAVYDAAPPDIRQAAVSQSGGAQNLIFITRPNSLEERAKMVDAIEAKLKVSPPPGGIEATPSGLAVVGVGLLKNLEANRILLTYLAIGFVFLFLSVRLRSVIRSLLSLVPVLIAVGTASLVAYFGGFKLSPMTAVGGPLVVAACTEFTSLILLRFVEERGRGLSPKEAVDVTAARTGRAFIVSALTAISGVAVIAGSSLPLLRDFGLVVAMNVAVALLSALVVLPPILVWADERGWVSKGMIPKDVLAKRAREQRATEVEPNIAPAD